MSRVVPIERVVAIVQARMGSARLPGKVLAEIAGRPMLEWVVRRALAIDGVDDVVVATTEEQEDDVVALLAAELGVGCVRGSTCDVLGRTLRAAASAGADVVVRITADDPLKDPQVCGRVLGALLVDPEIDYASNTLVPTFPEGVDVECVRRSVLDAAGTEATLSSEREHVTPFVWTRPERFRLLSVEHDVDLSGLRWTVDHADDLAFVRAVYDALEPKMLFGMDEVLALLRERPELATINAGHRRGEGYRRSLDRDEAGG